MNKFLWSCAALLTLFVTVEALRCYTSDHGCHDSCCAKTSINCTEDQDRCYVAVAKFSHSQMDIQQRGCIEKSSCNDSTGSILNVNYTITRTCCSTSLCNGAASTQLPFTAALGAALLVVWRQLGL